MYFKMLLKDFVYLLASSIIGLVLLSLVFCIPQDQMYKNYQDSLTLLDSRDGWHQIIPGYIASTLDSNTDHCMLKTCGTPLPDTGENIIQKALRAYRVTFENTHGMRFFSYEYKGQTLSCDSYERYWHGYALVLKPLMLFFDYMDITYINWAVSMIIMIILLLSIYKKAPRIIVPVSFLWVIGMQLVNFFCLVYSISFYVYAAGVLVILFYRKELLEKHSPFIFLMLGIAVQYFELLCFPLITLIVPMMVFLSIIESDPVKKLSASIVCSIQWAIGYAGMWASKWIIASMLLDDNVIKNALKQILLRSNITEDVDEKSITILSSFTRVLWAFKNKGVYFILLTGLLLLIVYVFSKKKQSSINPLNTGNVSTFPVQVKCRNVLLPVAPYVIYSILPLL